MQAMRKYAEQYRSDQVEWHHVKGGPDFNEYELDYEYSVLGYDVKNGRLDMLMRFKGNGGFCERHRHAASTTTLVLEGEQHLHEQQNDGSVKHIIRKTGDYALAGSDALPHMETSGPDGCTFLLSLHAPEGILFEVLDEEFSKLADVSIEDFVTRWENR